MCRNSFLSFPLIFVSQSLFSKHLARVSFSSWYLYIRLFIIHFLLFLRKTHLHISVFFHYFSLFMKQERAPTMAEHELYSSVLDHHSVEYPFSCVLETIENSYSSNENNSQFVFTIEPSLLIDPRNVKIGRVIGDGPNSTVYEGLWVPSLFLSLPTHSLTCFLYSWFLFLLMIKLLTFSACLLMFLYAPDFCCFLFCFVMGFVHFYTVCIFVSRPLL